MKIENPTIPDILKSSSKKTILCFSIIVTSKCNAHCSYCHFFAHRNRKKNYDISTELFDIYTLFISKLKNILPTNIELQCRFSGGEPLVLKDKLFKLSKQIYDSSSIKPYILTNGKAINQTFLKKAQCGSINFLAVSLENPLHPDRGAANPNEIMNKIKKYNSENFPIIPAVVIVKNEDFKNLYKICRIFYKKLGVLPTISELNFQAFAPPTQAQLKALYKNIFKIVKKFYLKTPIKLFPYISPELCYGGFKHYVTELNLENKHNLTKDNLGKKLYQVLNQLEISYPEFDCKNKKCDWHDDCKRIKWVWKKSSEKLNIEKKLEAYCKLKKTINSAFYEALKGF